MFVRPGEASVKPWGKTDMDKSSSLCLLVAATLITTACNPDDPPLAAFPDGLQAVWGEMFAPYGLYPLFPVRSDVQPGDVVAMCRKAPLLEARVAAAVASSSVAGDELVAKPDYEWRQLFSLPGVHEALALQASSRMAYHAFPNPSASTPLGAASGVGPYNAGVAPVRVGFASFPTVLAYSQHRKDLGVGTAVGVAAVGAGASKTSQGTYLLEIPAAEYVALSHSQLQKVLSAAAITPTKEVTVTLAGLRRAFNERTCIPGSLSVVGEAFYARRISVSVGDSYASAISARAAYQLPIDSTRAQIFKALGSYATGASAPAGAASAAFPIETTQFAKLIIDIDAAYQAADTNSKLGFTGVKAGVSRSGGKGVSMDYTYTVPVAFGVRLYSLQLENDGTLSDQLSLDGSRPWKGVSTPLEGLLQGSRPPTSSIPPPPPPASSSQK